MFTRIRESEARFASMLASMTEGVVLHEADGSIVACNARAESTLGLTSDQMLGRTPFDPRWHAMHADGSDWPGDSHPHMTALARGLAVEGAVMGIRWPDGSVVWLEVNAAPLGDAATPTGAVTTFMDITRRRALELEQGALRHLAEAAAAGTEPSRLCALVGDELVRVLGVVSAQVVRFEGTRAVVVACSCTGGALCRRPGDAVDLDDSAVGGVWRTRAAVRLPAGGGREASQRGERVAVPLRIGGRPWGALEIAASPDVELDADIEERLAHFTRVTEVAIAEAEARTALANQLERQAAIAALGQLAAEGLPPAELFHVALEQVLGVLGAAQAAVVELDGAAQVRHVAVVGVGPILEGSRTRFAAGGAVGRALAGGTYRAARGGGYGRRGGAAAIAAGIRTRTGIFGALLITRERPFEDGDPAFVGAVANVLAAALERESGEDELRRLALHDSLTGLPNRALLMDRLARGLAAAAPGQRSVAVLFCDVDGFKDVNDSHGHGVGDRLLGLIAERMGAALDPDDTFARFGGDELVVVRTGVPSAAAAAALARRLLDALAEPFELAGIVLRVTASIGLTLRGPEDAAEDVVRDADTAMYRAKALGRGRIEVFDAAMRETMLAQVELDGDARLAVERDELRVHYQPVIRLDDGEIGGFEALVRWQHPLRGLLGPQSLIEAAERTGAIIEVGRFVIERACRDAARMALAGREIDIAVNLSPIQLGDPGIVEHVAACLKRAGLSPARLALELTESALLAGDEEHHARLAALRALGVRLLLDDFGTGYSSLGYLQRLPLDGLKLDRSFVAGLGSDVRATTIVAAVVQLSHALGLPVTAEGVESPEQVVVLQSLGCERAQGFWYSRPVPYSEAVELLQRGTPLRGAAD